MRQNRCRKKFWQATHADSPQGATLGLSALAWRFRGYDAYVRTVPKEPGN